MKYIHSSAMVEDNNRLLTIFISFVVALLFLIFVISGANAAPGAGMVENTTTLSTFSTIQAAIDDAGTLDGHTLLIGTGTFAEDVDITKDLTLKGQGQGVTIIDTSSDAGYGVADNDLGKNVVLEDFTVTGANHYGVKLSGGTATVKNVTVEGSARTEMDFNGMSSVIIENVTLNGMSTSGNGLSFTDSHNVSVAGLTTMNNDWGGTAVYTYGRYHTLGSDNLTLSGVVASEPNPLYVQRGNYNDPGNPEPVTNLVADQFKCTVESPTLAPNYTWYQYNKAAAEAAAAGNPDAVITCIPNTGEILSPLAGSVVAGTVNLSATYEDNHPSDSDGVQWAVREGTCAANTNTVGGNVDGYSDSYSWDNMNFSSSLDSSGWNDGMYCFIFNPTDDSGENNVRETSEFYVDNTAPEQVLGMTIWHDGQNIGCGASVTERLITVDWNDSTDPNFAYYNYQADDGVGSIDFTTTVGVSERTGSIRDTDGTYQYRVRAVDSVGNIGDWSDWCHVTLDREWPIVAITSPLDGAVLSNSVDIVGSVTDNLELSHYNMSLYPSTTDLSDGNTHSGDRLNDANWCTTPTSGTVLTSVDVVGNLCTAWDTTAYPNGEYQIRLAARDASGLRDTSDPYTGATTSVHVIDIAIENGEELGIIDEPTDGDEKESEGEVLGATDEGEVLAETGSPAFISMVLGALILSVVLATAVFSRNSKISLR